MFGSFLVLHYKTGYLKNGLTEQILNMKSTNELYFNTKIQFKNFIVLSEKFLEGKVRAS